MSHATVGSSASLGYSGHGCKSCREDVFDTWPIKEQSKQGWKIKEVAALTDSEALGKRLLSKGPLLRLMRGDDAVCSTDRPTKKHAYSQYANAGQGISYAVNAYSGQTMMLKLQNTLARNMVK